MKYKTEVLSFFVSRILSSNIDWNWSYTFSSNLDIMTGGGLVQYSSACLSSVLLSSGLSVRKCNLKWDTSNRSSIASVI